MDTKSTMPSNQLTGKSTAPSAVSSPAGAIADGDMGSNGGARRPFAAGMGHGTGGDRARALSQRLCWSGSEDKDEHRSWRLPWERKAKLGSLEVSLGGGLG
ncbi:hypothetical protein VC83_06728 [Pseudogymnoascus destructans]|uniref:Uncharacterized protein n=1 Tax=Pseudogymnoascus destructans TaxID=655981 RepID=A0A177A567_9PEZI|nr:uncharacterized protein VC83_06728 [Pseudogymnoascus destructans]OAF56381.1 hypothetical protein VC83_06728 [Pseudogymnoascus destructans]